MQKRLNWQFVVIVGLMCVLLVTGLTANAQNDTTAHLRFVHVIPGAPAVDIYTDGQLTISNLTFGSATNYIIAAAGSHQLTVTEAGGAAPLWQQTVEATANTALTLVAASSGTLNFTVYADDLNPLPLGKARFTAVHAVSGAQAVDVILPDGRVVLPSLQFGSPDSAGKLDLGVEFTYDLLVVPSGSGPSSAILTLPPLALNSGTSYMALVYGSPASPEFALLSAPTQLSGEGGFVRLVHGVPDAPAVDIYVNETLAFPSLEFGESTGYIALPPGAYDTLIRAAGTQQNITTASLNVNSGEYATGVALASGDGVAVSLFSDAVSTLSGAEAAVGAINGLSGDGSISLTLENGSTLLTVAAGETDSAVLAPTRTTVTAEVTDGEGANQFAIADAVYGGVYYSALVVNPGAPQVVVLSPASIAQGIASAPEAASVEAVQLPSATEVPNVAATAAAVTTTAAGPTGIIYNLDADRNLQLRQYPNTFALSLGTVPPGTQVVVNGREGAIVAFPNSATPTPPQDYEYVDPASLLTDARQDIAPEATWLFISYSTPDGGVIDAWANALYVDVRNERGEKQRLADLVTVPANQPGETRNTAVTPPPIPQDRVSVIVFNLDPNVNLNIRRTPTVDGEVLARVSNGVVMELLGVSEARDWFFVRYTPDVNSVITGWSTALYLNLSYNGRLTDFEELEERELLVITPTDTRGAVTGNIQPVVRPTADPTKDVIIAEVISPGNNNLHLRRRANSDSESLALIPNGTNLVVAARSSSGEWLQVTFEGQTGWISSSFARLTFNGKAFDLAEVPLEGDAVDTFTPVPGATPIPPTGPASVESFDDIINENTPGVVNDDLVQVRARPDGGGFGMPLLSRNTFVTILYRDSILMYIELEDGTRGFVPAGSVINR